MKIDSDLLNLEEAEHLDRCSRGAITASLCGLCSRFLSLTASIFFKQKNILKNDDEIKQ